MQYVYLGCRTFSYKSKKDQSNVFAHVLSVGVPIVGDMDPHCGLRTSEVFVNKGSQALTIDLATLQIGTIVNVEYNDRGFPVDIYTSPDIKYDFVQGKILKK